MLIAALAACFSETGSPAAPGEAAACDIPLDSPVFGGDEQIVVAIRNFAFQQPDLRVAPGTRVTWVNCDAVAHSSTSDNGAWDSGLLETGDSFSRVFDETGEFPYHCTPHPSMQATVIVEES